MHEDGGSGGFEGLAGIEEVECGDAGGELAGPERNRRIVGVGDGRGDDFAAAGDEDVVLVESENGSGVGEGEFMKGFDKGDERLRKHNHARVINGTEDFLELHHRCDEEKLRMGEDLSGGRCEEVDGITGDK